MSRYKTYFDYTETGSSHSRGVKSGFVGKSHSVVRTKYKVSVCEGVDHIGSSSIVGNIGPAYWWDSDINHSLSSNDINLLFNNVIDKFEGKCGTQAALGSSIFAEGLETVGAAVGRLQDMANLVKSIRKKDVRAFKRLWDKKPQSIRGAAKQVGGKWLEFSFGWIPLVQTISDAMTASGQDFPAIKIHASSRISRNLTSFPIRGPNWGHNDEVEQFVKIGYDVRVNNPNTWLLGNLGLLNPLEWVWEAIPYSFFVDYFTNIGDLIHNMSSFAGLSLENGYTTYYHKYTLKHYYKTYTWDHYKLHYSGQGYHIGRQGPTPLRRRLVWNDNPLTSSWQRGANASSFLAQFFRS